MSFRKLQKLETTKVFLREEGSSNVYQLVLTPDGVSWGQTFTEKTYKSKTIENQNFLRDKGVFKKANTASFSFTIPLVKENHISKKIFDLLVGTTNNTLKSFTLWFIDADKSVCIETCVISSGNFNIQMGQPISLSIDGVGGKLSVFKSSSSSSLTEIIGSGSVDFGIINSNSLAPVFAQGDLQAESSRTILTLDRMRAEYSSTAIDLNIGHVTDRLIKFSVEVQNKVKWLPHQTVNGAISTTGKSNIQYPSQYVLEGQTIAGNITTVAPVSGTVTKQGIAYAVADGGINENQQFVENSDFKFAIQGKAGTTGVATVGSNFGISFICSAGINVTKTVEAGPFWTTSHNWRTTGANTSALSSLLTYTTA